LRKVREDETTNELFAFWTKEPNPIGALIDAKAVPVILATQEEIDAWMSARASTTAI
jgi:putative SOS response-associated peptidase YedK